MVLVLEVKSCCSERRRAAGTGPLIQHGVQLVGEVVKHVPYVIQDGPCRPHRDPGPGGTRNRFSELQFLHQQTKGSKLNESELTRQNLPPDSGSSPQPSELPQEKCWSHPVSAGPPLSHYKTQGQDLDLKSGLGVSLQPKRGFGGSEGPDLRVRGRGT